MPLGDLVTERAWKRLSITTALVIGVVLLPLFLGFDHTVVNITLYVSIYAILALGLNVLVGYTGLLELGYVTFIATGAIVTSLLLLLTHTDAGWVLPVGTTERIVGDHPFTNEGMCFLIIFISGAVCAGLGVLRGLPIRRLTGDYYAIVTLGIGEIFFRFYLNADGLTGGAFGLKLTQEATPYLFGNRLSYDSWQFYYLVMLFVGLTIVVMDRLSHSRVGRAWAAIRLDETAARACGINIPRYKTIAFSVSGFVGGVGGSLFAIWLGGVYAKELDVWISIMVLCAVVLGGMGSIRGVLLGSLILFSLREVLREPIFGTRLAPEASYLVYGLLLVFVMRFRPQGLLPRLQGESVPMTAEEEAELRASTPKLFVLKETRES